MRVGHLAKIITGLPTRDQTHQLATVLLYNVIVISNSLQVEFIVFAE